MVNGIILHYVAVFNIRKSGNERDIQIYAIVQMARKKHILHIRSSSARDWMTR